jgi:hypothetical protein
MECKEDYITVFANPIAEFTIDNIEGCVAVLVNFSDNSSSQNGNFVFHADDINEAWDGKYKSQDVTPGVYVYKVRLICPYDRNDYYIVGDVTVIGQHQNCTATDFFKNLYAFIFHLQ